MYYNNQWKEKPHHRVDAINVDDDIEKYSGYIISAKTVPLVVFLTIQLLLMPDINNAKIKTKYDTKQTRS